MDIAYEEIKMFEEKLINKVLYFALEGDYKKQIEIAKEIFKKNYTSREISINESCFVPWLLWSYRLQNGNNFLEEYIEVKSSDENDESLNLLKSISNAKLSIYEILEKNSDNLKLNDILLNKQVTVKNTLEFNDIEIGTLILARIYNYENQNFFINDYIIIDKTFKSVIERSFYEKYMEYQEKYGFVSKEDFIKYNSILIYDFANIIDELISKSLKDLESQDRYSVYQSTYLVLDFQKVKDKFLNYENAELDYEENGNFYFHIYSSKKILCEIVLNKFKLEIECVSKTDRIKAKKLIENMIKEHIKHVKDEMLMLDDIL
ncbi:hypothetical protein SAMN02745883_00508 [Caminicella sporogenes DSM 14501]|uniref:Uncharacterized protein n=1 Tax=Caminicella sporogenes DSM 14501 TaxID=1121266 RepID=A0A1M6MEG3_9FIRM|nr:hypothetical protein [Caminicella sporogenes]RKD27583.1 hypothetical protein BET04_00495 [Caminicella sporogenes]WIF94831.1 hypothetical protein QNI18_11300 [Caminicella sporogenes]SHJ81827.1 hypothetical protein SAMN02745883_00508 [Caminicella sporogenes DSM 14501]